MLNNMAQSSGRYWNKRIESMLMFLKKYLVKTSWYSLIELILQPIEVSPQIRVVGPLNQDNIFGE